MSFVLVAVGTAAAGIGGAIIQSNAAKDAANTQANAANNASNLQWQEYQQARNDQQPWRDAGAGAIKDLTGQMSTLNRPFSMADFQADPGYQFRMSEGQKAIERAASANGGNSTGATMKALTGYNSGLASQEYQNAFDRYNVNNTNTFNRLASVAGIGQTANAQTSAAGMNAANNIGQNIMGAGNAQAAGQVAGANAISNGISQGMGGWMQASMMNRMFPGSSPGAGGFGMGNTNTYGTGSTGESMADYSSMV